MIFEPFFTTKGLLAGGDQANPGLGLSLVHGIVHDMGGRIEVKSAVGRGPASRCISRCLARIDRCDRRPACRSFKR